MKAAIEIERCNRRMELILAPLEVDVKFASTQLVGDKKNQQFWRRTIIRCLLAYTEALVWSMKACTPLIASVSNTKLTVADLEILHEQRTISRDGKTEVRPNFLKFRDNLKATFSLFAKAYGTNFKVECNKGFDALCEIYDLRSRLMHPKEPFDINVSDSNTASVEQGYLWLSNEYARLMDECEKASLQFGIKK